MAQQQQQQALHAAGGNMYMGGGGMAAIGGMHQMHQRLGYPRTNNQRPPNVNVGPPDGLGNSIAGRGVQQEWRHVLMQQQQGFQAQMRSQFNQQSHQGERKREKDSSDVIVFVEKIASQCQNSFNSEFALSSNVLVLVGDRECACRFVLFGYKRINANRIHRELSATGVLYRLLFVKII